MPLLSVVYESLYKIRIVLYHTPVIFFSPISFFLAIGKWRSVSVNPATNEPWLLLDYLDIRIYIPTNEPWRALRCQVPTKGHEIGRSPYLLKTQSEDYLRELFEGGKTVSYMDVNTTSVTHTDII